MRSALRVQQQQQVKPGLTFIFISHKGAGSDVDVLMVLGGLALQPSSLVVIKLTVLVRPLPLPLSLLQTMLTAISMSAIATNGVVPGG